MAEVPDILYVEEAARLLRISVPYLYKKIQKQEIAALRFGEEKGVRLEASEVNRFIRRHRTIQRKKRFTPAMKMRRRSS